MAEVREAKAVWEGDLAKGHGAVSGVTSGRFTDLAVTWASRTEAAAGRTSPEELLAAAHAACFSMALAARLGKAGTPPERLDVTARVTFERRETGWAVARSDLVVRGRVPGADAAAFRTLAEDAKENCPISRALRGNVELGVQAELAG